jgi:hypothetical protein
LLLGRREPLLLDSLISFALLRRGFAPFTNTTNDPAWAGQLFLVLETTQPAVHSLK